MKRGYIPVDQIRKNLFKIKAVCETLGVTARTLRWYEQLGLLPLTQRTRGRIRLYTAQDIELIKTIKKYRQAGHKLAEIKDILQKQIKIQQIRDLKIFIDSAFSVPLQLALENKLDLIPMNIHLGCYTYKDFVTFSPETFSGAEAKKRTLARTSPPSAEEYIKIFEQAFSTGYKQIISLHPDSRLSGSYKNALTAAATLKSLPIEVIDTKLFSLGFYFVLTELRKKYPKNITELKKMIVKLQNNVTEIIVINSMERFLAGAVDEQARQILSCIPILQHTAKSGLVPIARENDLLSALKYVVKQLKKSNELVVGYSDWEILKKAEPLLKKFQLNAKAQYSNVLLANFGRSLLGIAVKVI